MEPLDPLPARVNYFRGSDPRQWRSGIPTYSRVKFREIYPGIDAVYYFDQAGQLEYDFVVAPGADPSVVRFRFEGTRDVTVDPAGDLVLQTAGTPVIVRKPKVYQILDGVPRDVRGRFVVTKNQEVGFTIEKYDAGYPLWIDPIFDYSTYLGGADIDEARSVAVDAVGNVYITGYTWSVDFPTVDAWQPSTGGTKDVFVSKFDPNGVLQYSTYFGGLSSDEGRGISVDLAGNVFITGFTTPSFYGSGFPVTIGAFQTASRGMDAFVAKLDPLGALAASTLLGGSSWDQGFAIAVDTAGNPYVTGLTSSSDFPVLTPLQAAWGGNYDAFLTKFDSDLTGLVYSTYLGGAREDRGQGVAVDAAGNASVVGLTASADFPTANAIQTNLRGATDAFVAKLNSSGSSFGFSTYFGGGLPSSRRKR